MSAQTPQTDLLTLIEVLRIAIQRAEYAEQAEQDLERDLSHYKALCEELREALKYARRFMKADSDIAYVDIAVMKADHALKKAQKDI